MSSEIDLATRTGGRQVPSAAVRGIWERLHYDWSDPNRVVLTTTDSNTWGGASGHTYTFKPLPDGRTEVELVTVARGGI
jgi:hypothetical protein